MQLHTLALLCPLLAYTSMKTYKKDMFFIVLLIYVHCTCKLANTCIFTLNEMKMYTRYQLTLHYLYTIVNTYY